MHDGALDKYRQAEQERIEAECVQHKAILYARIASEKLKAERDEIL